MVGSAHEDAVAHDVACPLRNLITCAVFALYCTLAELDCVQA